MNLSHFSKNIFDISLNDRSKSYYRESKLVKGLFMEKKLGIMDIIKPYLEGIENEKMD